MKILISSHQHPSVRTFQSILVEQLLSVLKQKMDVEIIWVIYRPYKEKIVPSKTPQIKIVWMWEYNNAVELLENLKPEIILTDLTLFPPAYAFIIAGKYKKIPVASWIQYSADLLISYNRTSNKFRNMKTLIERFSSNEIPGESIKKPFLRGTNYLHKLSFLFRTLLATKKNFFRALIELIPYIKYSLTINAPIDSRLSVDLIWLSNDSFIPYLTNAGLDKTKFVVTGDPTWDRNLIQKVKFDIKKNIGKIKVLLLPISLAEHGLWTWKEQEHVFKSIVSKINDFSNDIELKIKLHPSTSPLEIYRSWVNSINPKIPIFQKEELIEILATTDVVISYGVFSGGHIEPLIARKPLILVDIINDEKNIPLLSKTDFAKQCKEISGLIPMIKETQSHEKTSEKKLEEFLRKISFRFDGKSAERLADAIINVVKR